MSKKKTYKLKVTEDELKAIYAWQYISNDFFDLGTRVAEKLNLERDENGMFPKPIEVGLYFRPDFEFSSTPELDPDSFQAFIDLNAVHITKKK